MVCLNPFSQEDRSDRNERPEERWVDAEECQCYPDKAGSKRIHNSNVNFMALQEEKDGEGESDSEAINSIGLFSK